MSFRTFQVCCPIWIKFASRDLCIMLFRICECRQYRHNEGRTFLTGHKENTCTQWLGNRVVFAKSRTPCWCPYSTSRYTLILILLEMYDLVSPDEKETCGLITKVLVVGNSHKVFCIVFCGVKLTARLFLV